MASTNSECFQLILSLCSLILALADSGFGQTFQYITSIKLAELERQRSACTGYVKETLKAASEETTPYKRADTLLRRIRSWTGVGRLVGEDIDYENLECWLWQAHSDPSVTDAEILKMVEQLEKELAQALRRYDYAKLFGDLLSEWLTSGDSLATSSPSDQAVESRSNKREGAHFCFVRFATGITQQAQIQKLITEAKEVNVDTIKAYLDDLFSESAATTALTNLRKHVQDYGDVLSTSKLRADEMPALMQSLLARDLLSAEKSATLKSFLNNEVILEEVASVLNMMLASLDDWDWPADGVPIEMRRNIAGRYRAYMDNEIMQALLFQYIGVKWSTQLKDCFKKIAQSRAWKPDSSLLSEQEEARRCQMLDWTRGSSQTIQGRRRDIRLNQFFCTQLPDEFEEEADYDEEPKAGEKYNHGVSAQQALLRLVATETHLQRTLYGSSTIMRADLEWFGPSIPHQSILTVLEFFGIPEKWLGFFRKWLSAKMRFEGSEIQIRKRGVPIAHALSVLCGEAILFAMDFAVNQRADGLYVYRIYDDFWFQSHDASKCAAAWREMKTVADLVGITFNMKKTGGACVGAPLEPSLPRGAVAWGFLVFDSEKGRFVVDQKAVDIHIAELTRQLAAAKSVMGYVNCFNKYMEFFRRNFAQPAQCFGMAHADEIISTFQRIQRAVFADTNGSVVGKIRQLISERFDVTDIPAGWCFLPSSEGGLGIANPVVTLLSVRRQLPADPSAKFAAAMGLDQGVYEGRRYEWAGGPTGDREFLTYAEFTEGRETYIPHWGTTWAQLQETAHAKSPVKTGLLHNDARWRGRSEVERWIVAFYAREIFEMFGGFKMVEETLIPVGMLKAFQTAKIAWDT
uniref:Uncharacterized protein n=1 Tax=Schizophyllum commune (strain H4-8 / FGSC 9210) TaxID=578458 RepID=D8Q933_SCHCM